MTDNWKKIQMLQRVAQSVQGVKLTGDKAHKMCPSKYERGSEGAWKLVCAVWRGYRCVSRLTPKMQTSTVESCCR